MAAVTVVIPTRGPTTYLEEAVVSVTADASADAEFIVVEDGTRLVDDAWLRDLLPKAQLVRLPYVGRSAARNEGVRRARTELVAFLDADDVSLPDRLGRQAELFAARPDATLCFGRVEAIDASSGEDRHTTEAERARFDRLLQRGLHYESLLVDCPIYTSGTMVRRKAFLDVGAYRSALDAYEDLDLYLRLAEREALAACDGAAVARHRIHGSNTPVPDLFAGSIRLARLHLAWPGRTRRARALLRMREAEGLWALGDFAGARRAALTAVAEHPRLLAQPGALRRVMATLLPAAALHEVRARRS